MAEKVTFPVSSIFVGRFFPAFGASAVLYDHIITFDDEVTFIWLNRSIRPRSKLLFAINRYASDAMITYMAYAFSGSGGLVMTDSVHHSKFTSMPFTHSNLSCRTFVWFFATFSAIFVTISHFFIILRIYTLWDKRKNVAYVLVAVFVVCISVTTAFTILTAHDLQPHMHFNVLLHSCAIGNNYVPKALPVALGSTSVFDLFILGMVTLNVLHRPRGYQVKVLHELQRDGFLMFLALFLLRLANLLVSLLGDSTTFFVLLSTVWALCAIANARLHIRVESLRFYHHPGLDPMEDLVLYMQ